MKIVQLGLIGFGSAARVFHEPIITSVEGLHIAKIYATNHETLRKLHQKYDADQITSDVNDILADETIELVVLAVPNSAHYPLAKKALDSGKNVVVEKPFTITSEEAEQLIELAKSKNKLLSIHHNRRWDSDFKTVQKILDAKVLGDLVEYEAHFDRFRNAFKENSWRETDAPGSGILYDLGSHLIDQAQCLFGIPQEVFADLQIQRKGGKSIDHFEILLHYAGLKVTLKAGMLVKEQGPHFRLLGTNGSFTKYGMDIQEENLKKGQLPKNDAAWGVEPESLWGTLNTEINSLHFIGKVESEVGDYRAYYKNVYKAILGEEELKVRAEQAKNTIKIIELAEKSNREKSWVSFR